MIRIFSVIALLVAAAFAFSQALPPGFGPRQRRAGDAVPEQQQQQQQQQQQPQRPSPVPGAPAPANQPNAQTLAAEQRTTPTELPPTPTGVLNLQNASLVEFIDTLARQLKINYILDPRIKGGVTINTYGETKSLDLRNLLDLVLRINGAAMVRVSDNLYRIVPLADVLRMPGLRPEIGAKDIEETDAPMLNLLFLKYATVEELAKLLDPFIGEGGRTIAYPPANLLLIQDSRRNMKRLMELISQFDSETFTGQRVRLFEVRESRPSDIAKELDSIFRGISLSEKTSAVKFLPVDRINTLIAVASNPGVFDSVENWLKKLDIPVQITAGSIDNYVYRVKYGRADGLASAIMMLYGGGYGYGGYGMGYGGYGGGMGGGFGSPYAGGMGGGIGAYGGGGFGGGFTPSFTPTYQPNAGVLGGPIGSVVTGGAPQQSVSVTNPMGGGAVASTGTATGATARAAADQTGQYLGTQNGLGTMEGIPRVVPNPMDNSLLIQASPQQYAGILKLLRQLDIPPRQVLIDAKIYEVSLTGAFQYGVAAALQRLGTSGSGGVTLPTRQLVGTASSSGLTLTMGTLVGASRQLLAAVNASETSGKTKVISAPSVIATDSIPASINVGAEIPTLTGQAVTGFQSGGNSLFAQNIQNRNTGVTLNILAHVNASGVVTMVVNQEVSSPQAAGAGDAIQSPSFSKRTVQTQLTVQDGDTVAIGGIIDEKNTVGSSGIPGLNRVPVVGGFFGARSYSKSRTELIIFLTPRVIYDTADVVEASDELRQRLKRVNRLIKDE